MTYSFNIALSNDVSLVRFHIGDNHSEGYYLDDETIIYLVANHGVSGAVIRAIRYIITQLSKPDFKQDWLSVTNAEARAGYEKLLKEKAQELGVSLSGVTVSSSVALPYRADSYMTSGDQDGAP